MLNGEKVLPRCLRSLEAQTYDDFDLVAVNDGSTDRTQQILTSFCKKSHIIQLSENKGIPTANNYARDDILACGYSHICWVAADDEWRPKKLEVQLDQHTKDGCHVSYADFTLIGQDGKIQPVKSPEWDSQKYVWLNFIHGSTIMWNRGVLENLAWDEKFRNCEDWDYGLTCIEEGYTFKHIPKDLCISYRHEANISNKRVKEAYYHALVSMKHNIPLVVDAARMMRIGDPNMISGVLEAVFNEKGANQEDD